MFSFSGNFFYVFLFSWGWTWPRTQIRILQKVLGRVVDPDADPDSVTLWIRIRIGNPDPGARKLRNFIGKMHFLVIFSTKF
jgi:hypothetical protein